jgi:hypothetical protein
MGEALRRAPAGLNRLIGEYESAIRPLYRVAFVIVLYGGFQWIGDSSPAPANSAGIELALDDIAKALDGIATAMRFGGVK